MVKEEFTEEVANRMREEHLKESLEVSGEPRHGYIGYMQPLCISDTSQAHVPHYHGKNDPIGSPNVRVNKGKKGRTLDVYFSHAEPLCSGDPFQDSIKDSYRRDPTNVTSQFRPAGVGINHGLSKGVDYIELKTGYENRAEIAARNKGRQPIRGVFTNPPPKGKNHLANKYLPDDYENARKLKNAEKAQIESKMKGVPSFRGGSHGNQTFSNNSDTYGGAHSSASPAPPGTQIRSFSQPRDKAPFIPSNPAKSGVLASIAKYPEYMPGQDAKLSNLDGFRSPFRQRQPGQAEWRSNHIQDYAHPTPSVSLNVRNLKAERPLAFMRPSRAGASIARGY